LKILIKNAKVFNGRENHLKENANIIIEENLVKEITQQPVSEENFEQIIDAQGRVVIPGLVDNHAHIASQEADVRPDETVVHGVATAKRMLLNGFTTVRDAGGLTYGVKKGIDEGLIDGPRIYPSYAYISQTCGHGDMRESRAHTRLTDGQYTSPQLRSGATYIADGPYEVLKAVREQLFLGASQIKIMAGGGFSSKYDPVQTTQFTEEEMKAAVNAASDYGTYVMAHLYTKEAMHRAARAGVKSFEHAHLIDEELAKIIADKGIFLCSCPQFGKKKPEQNTDKKPLPPKRGGEEIRAAIEKQAELIIKYNIKLLFGTDFVERIVGNNPQAQIGDLQSYEERFGSFRGLFAATGSANEVIKLTTYQNPYPDGKIGVLEEGAFADLLIVDGNPLEKLSVLSERKNLRLIMKDAKIYKNTLEEEENA
jgi:imidazolonepropionase-like amidohydrolase